MNTPDSTLTRGYGTIAGFAFIGTTVMLAPSTLLLEPIPAGHTYLVSLVSMITGFVIIGLPWERIQPVWLNVLGPIAVAEAMLAVAVFGLGYSVIYFVIAIAIAYVAPTPRVLTIQFAIIFAGLFAPLIWNRAEAQEVVRVGLLVMPMIALTGGLVAFMRMRMVADHRSYRQFAGQTLELASRIAGQPLRVGGNARRVSELPSWSRKPAIGSRTAMAAAVLMAIPLAGAGLANAGVSLPHPVDKAYEGVGVDLPNQSRDLNPISVPQEQNPTNVPDELKGDDGNSEPNSAGPNEPAPPAPSAADEPTAPAPPAPAEEPVDEGSAPPPSGGLDQGGTKPDRPDDGGLLDDLLGGD